MTATQSRPATPNRPMARRLAPAELEAHLNARSSGARTASSFRKIATIAAIAGLVIVAGIGAMHPQPVAGGAGPAATGAVADPTVGSAYAGADITGGLNVVDLATKGTVVLVLLFITLRVLARYGGNSPKKSGRLQVLESRTLAQKASLHLVAVGDRRLVVGLTPSGMVSLAELDAAELETADVLATGGATDPAGAATPAAAGTPAVPAPFGAMLNTLMAPIDAATARLAGLLAGGRAR